eukprot:604680_1
MVAALIILWMCFSLLLSQTVLDDQAIAIAIVDELRYELRTAFDLSGKHKPLLATTVRLSFHDCGGPLEDHDSSTSLSICNGCVAIGNIGNFGLESGAIVPLEIIYLSYDDVMSRADFWAAAATIALEYAQALDVHNKHDILRSIPFYFGRRDCSTSPDGFRHREFPDGHAGWKETLNWFSTFLGISVEDTIALLGAHTLGRTHQEFSGFDTRPWVKQSFILDNQYYMDIIAKKWSPVEVNCRSPFGCKWEWHTKGNRQHSGNTLMLNSDMSMWNDIDPFLDRRTGEVTCDWRTCPLNPVTKDVTLNYARHNQLWLDDFADAFERMITTGYTRDELVAVHVPHSAEVIVGNVHGDVDSRL